MDVTETSNYTNIEVDEDLVFLFIEAIGLRLSLNISV